MQIISKIENEAGLRNIDEIIATSDGIMVARGDLGMEIPSEKVALAQKMIITKCNVAGKIVITATQLMESMVNNPMPTRAEMTDVANAVFDGTDGVMLSGESANGAFPIASVSTMAAVVRNAEVGINYFQVGVFVRDFTPKPMCTREAVLCCAAKNAVDVGAGLIVIFSEKGHTPRIVAKYRPSVPVLVITSSEQVARHCSSVFSLIPYYTHHARMHMEQSHGGYLDTSSILNSALMWCVDKKICLPGSVVVLVKGTQELCADVQPTIALTYAPRQPEAAMEVAEKAREPVPTVDLKSTVSIRCNAISLDELCSSYAPVRKTKIICTLGPSSFDEETMGKLLDAGLNLARFNFSHGTHEENLKVLDRFRSVCERKNVNAAVVL